MQSVAQQREPLGSGEPNPMRRPSLLRHPPRGSTSTSAAQFLPARSDFGPRFLPTIHHQRVASHYSRLQARSPIVGYDEFGFPVTSRLRGQPFHSIYRPPSQEALYGYQRLTADPRTDRLYHNNSAPPHEVASRTAYRTELDLETRPATVDTVDEIVPPRSPVFRWRRANDVNPVSEHLSHAEPPTRDFLGDLSPDQLPTEQSEQAASQAANMFEFRTSPRVVKRPSRSSDSVSANPRGASLGMTAAQPSSGPDLNNKVCSKLSSAGLELKRPGRVVPKKSAKTIKKRGVSSVKNSRTSGRTTSRSDVTLSRSKKATLTDAAQSLQGRISAVQSKSKAEDIIEAVTAARDELQEECSDAQVKDPLSSSFNDAHLMETLLDSIGVEMITRLHTEFLASRLLQDANLWKQVECIMDEI